MRDVSAPDELTQHAEQFRASGLLGKPGTLSRLFDFLLARSLEGDAPKETEIALQGVISSAISSWAMHGGRGRML